MARERPMADPHQNSDTFLGRKTYEPFPKEDKKGLMDFAWERISNFGSLRERDCFLAWIRDQIANGVAEAIEAPAGRSVDAGERWFRHIPTGLLWCLEPVENPYGPGFWPAHDAAA